MVSESISTKTVSKVLFLKKFCDFDESIFSREAGGAVSELCYPRKFYKKTTMHSEGMSKGSEGAGPPIKTRSKAKTSRSKRRQVPKKN